VPVKAVPGSPGACSCAGSVRLGARRDSAEKSGARRAPLLETVSPLLLTALRPLR